MLGQKEKRNSRGKKELNEIFNFFIWNAEFQKQRKEYIKSLFAKERTI